jgi:hypothetical protein
MVLVAAWSGRVMTMRSTRPARSVWAARPQAAM